MDEKDIIKLDLSPFSPFQLSIFITQLRKLVIENKDYTGQVKVPKYLYETISRYLEANGSVKQI